MIDASFIVLEDGTRDKKVGEEIYEGQPVALDANGQLIAAVQGSKVYGLSKLDSNQYRDFAFGEYGAYGTGKVTIVKSGIARVKASVFGQIEIDSSATTSTPVTVEAFNSALTYTPGEALYVDANGLISNVPADAASKISLFGKVVKAVEDGWLELEITSDATTSIGDMAA